MIQLRQVTKKYGDFLALDRLTVSAAAGEIFGFIGPNGAGKTTTIKIMGGLLAPTQGDVLIGGINMHEDPVAAKQMIGFIPDRPYLYEKLTGMEFLRFIADLYGVDEKSFFQKAEEKLDLFSLSEWPDELIESYSHGMKQRLIMAAALMHDPKVIIVDEPMVGLDPVAIKLVKNLFRKLAAGGVTVFMSTHTLQVAEDICDRIGVIHKGQLIASGTTEDLRREIGGGSADLEKVFFHLTTDGMF
jgi:ABC-2 type transport system ATP-binding protein